MMNKNTINFLGIFICFLVSIVSYYVSNFVGSSVFHLTKSPLSTVTIAILSGLILRQSFTFIKKFDSGYQFCIKYLLKGGIIILGIKLSLSEVLDVSFNSLIVVVPSISFTIFLVLFIRSYFNIPKKIALLIAVGTSICGATAIVATAPVLNAKKEEVSFAVANITLFGLFAMIFYPYLANSLFSNNSLAVGLFLGSSIHDTAQVAGASLIYDQQFINEDVVKISTVTKLIRNTAMIIVIPFLAIKQNKILHSKNNLSSILKLFPLFIFGFILFIFFRSLGDFLFIQNQYSFYYFSESLWNSTVQFLSSISGFLLTISMAAVGISTDILLLKKMGIKIFYFGFVIALFVGFLSFLIIKYSIL